ncbi:HA2K protein, partial [Atractosteus spatula]|nr:HA2K protein [Atractosteus spatula]
MACETNLTRSEYEMELDKDELFYVDFVKKEGVQRLPEFAQDWYVGPDTVAQAQANMEVCRHNVVGFAKGAGYPSEKKVAPQTMVYPEDLLEVGQPNTLICFSTGFYPMAIKMSWTRNGQPVTEGVTQSQLYSNDDFTFRTFSYLSFSPQLGDIYSCRVEHSGLPEPDSKIYVVETNTESDVGETAYCGVGLTLGLLGVAAGTFFLIKGNNCN